MSGWVSELPDWLRLYWPHLSGLLAVLAAAVAGTHAVLSQRAVRSSIGWLGLILMVPIFGAVLYGLFGVNRIQRRAVLLRGKRPPRFLLPPEALADLTRDLGSVIGEHNGMLGLAHLVGRVTRRPLLAGNRIRSLRDGDEAYPAMIDAIAEARSCVTLLTYIFDDDAAGHRFTAALTEATRRGVEVRVLIDAAGARYSWRRADRELRRRGVPVARFLPFGLRVFRHFNLRNHRKILVVDGTLGFTGGMNIREGHVIGAHPKKPIRDLHFQVEGPVVAQMQESFAEDWEFTTGESLHGEPWFPALDACGPTLARGVSDGPDGDKDVLNWLLLGAIAGAQRSIRILTPYFLPDHQLTAALNAAALRGVAVDIVLPEKSNLPFVGWAMWGQLWTVLGQGCRVWVTPPPFDHSKIMVVDDLWSLFGSTNWDPRSLRLNFEFNVEAYCERFAVDAANRIQEALAVARPVTLEDLQRRHVTERLRDGLARLLTPYL